MIVRELVTRLSFSNDFRALDAWTRSADRAFDRIEARIQRLKRQNISLGGVLGGRGGNAGASRDPAGDIHKGIQLFALRAFGAVQGINAIRETFRAGDEGQNLRSRLALLPQSTGDAAADFEFIAQRANEIGVSLDSYGRTFARIGMAAKDLLPNREDVAKVVDTLNKSLLINGATTSEAAATSLQFSQAIGSKQLSGDEFRSLAENNPLFLDALSSAMGVPRELLKKTASEGKLTADRVLKATLAVAPTFEAMFSKLPMTVSRATTIVANKWELMIDRINRKTDFIGKTARAIVGWVDRIESAITGVVDANDGWNNTLRMFGALAASILGVQLVKYLYAIRNLSWAAVLPYAAWAAGVLLVAAAIEDLYVWINGGDSVLGEWLGKWEDFKRDSSLLKYLDSIGKYIGAIGAVMAGIFTGDWALTKEGFKGIMEAAKQAYGAVLQGLSGTLGSPESSLSPEQAARLQNVTPDTLFKGGNASNWVPGKEKAQNPFTSNTNVYLTVPPGTSQEQGAFLQRSAEQVFTRVPDKLARDLSTYTP